MIYPTNAVFTVAFFLFPDAPQRPVLAWIPRFPGAQEAPPLPRLPAHKNEILFQKNRGFWGRFVRPNHNPCPADSSAENER